MESSRDPEDPRTALAGADEARRRLTTSLRLPAGFFPVFAAGVAVQVGTAAYGIAAQTVTGVAVALAGVAVFLGVAALLLHRFSRVNGVRVDGLASQVVLAAGASASLVYLGALAVGIVAAFESRWWLVAVAAVVGGSRLRARRPPLVARLPARPRRPRARRLPAGARACSPWSRAWGARRCWSLG